MDAEERADRLEALGEEVRDRRAWCRATTQVVVHAMSVGDPELARFGEINREALRQWACALTRLRGMRAADLVDRGILDSHREIAITRDPSLEPLIDDLVPPDPFADADP